jgi:energy-coupling factor transporter ATP-binding protein EcfA2
MSEPDPQQENRTGILESILKAAEGLDQPLRFVIVFGVLIAALVILGAIVPDNLVPLLYVLLIGGMLLYAWWEYQNFLREKARQAHEREQARQAQEHEQRMRRLDLEEQQLPEPAAAPAPEPAPVAEVNNDDLERRYLHDQFLRCGTLSMAMIDPRAQHTRAAHLTLQSVFTALDVASTKQQERSEREVDWAKEEDRQGREPALEAIGRQQYLVLLGKPGSGKSTLVNFITYCLAGEGLGDQDVNLAQLGWKLPALLPLPVILREYAARGLPQELGLWEYLADELEAVELGAYPVELKKHLDRRGGILLLDGLDEVPEAHRRRQQLREAVLAFVRDFPKVRVLVTSRPYAYDADWQLPGFVRADLLDFSQEQIDGYINSWYAVTGRLDPDLSPARAEQYAEQLKREVQNNRNLAELAPRPLLLALMVSLHRWQHGGALPEKREELYDKSVDLLLDLWQRPKQLYDEQGRPTREETSALVELGITRDDVRDALSQVAYIAHRDQPELTGTAEIPGEQLAAALYNAPGRKQGVNMDDVIDYVKDRAGLLEERGVDREGRRIYAFPHRTFQEYLAACYLLAEDTYPEELVRLARGEPERWRETTLLAAGRGGAKAQASVWQLVQALCPGPLPDNLVGVSEDDWWGAFLAGRVLWDVDRLLQTKAERLQEQLAQVRDWLAALIAQGALPPLDRAAAGEVLDRLGWRPADLDRWIRCPGSADDGGDLLAMTYPVTNAQFELFMAAGGYENQAYWGAGRVEEKAPRYWDLPVYGRARRCYPVVGVSWFEAAAYGAWLSDLLDRARRDEDALGERERALVADLLVAGGKQARLPSQSEWARLAGGEADDRYPWDPAGGPATKEPAAILERANTSELGWLRTTPVYLYPQGASRPFGLMDLAGNVWEWTGSWYDEEQRGRVLRGGSFYDYQGYARVSIRNHGYPYNWFSHVGFRLVAPVGSGS